MPLSLGERLIKSLKAANYHAKVGDTIAGNLTRGEGGQFASGGGSAAKPEAKPKPAGGNADRTARDKLRAQQQADRQALADQLKQEKRDKALNNVGELSAQLLDSDMAEVLTTGDTLGDLSGVNAEHGDKLVAKGLAVKFPDGSYDMSPTGKTMLKAMAKGDARKAKQAIMKAQAVADRKAAIAAKPKRKKKETSLGRRILMAYKASTHAQPLTLPVTSLKETKPQGSFTAYKDVNNLWRWLSISSSGFEDRDGEIVSTKALAEDCARCDATKSYGPLDWWHTPIKLGTCDFNAMHNGLLVESGTFVNDRVAVALKAAIEAGTFQPGVSLAFAHSEPGPPVLPGRVFQSIRKEARALLPADAASNLASSLDIFNQGLTEKEESKKMLEQKLKQLEAILGPELTQQFLAGSEVAEKSLQMAGVAFKAAAALSAPMDKPVMGVGQLPDKKLAKKDDPLLDEALADEDMAMADEELAGAGDDEALEDSKPDQEADAILQGLFDTIGKLMTDKMSAFASEIQTALAGLNSTATKEAGAVAVALKEIAGLLPTLALKEQVDSLDNRLRSLEGEQPAIVQKRASQQQGLPASELPEVYRNMVAKESEDKDPYIQNAERMTANLFAQNAWLAPQKS